ncbi:MAG TPA: hypothetical protein VKD72_39740 [Gemmataceae bacterium]|nr:hypothetical protein [Gemmataceae bacterium]
MSPEETATPAPAEEWVEIYRGPRRRAQVIIRVMTDALIPARDARRLGAVQITPREGVVQVPASRVKDATAQMEMLKKNFPALFVAGAAKGD